MHFYRCTALDDKTKAFPKREPDDLNIKAQCFSNVFSMCCSQCSSDPAVRTFFEDSHSPITEFKWILPMGTNIKDFSFYYQIACLCCASYPLSRGSAFDWRTATHSNWGTLKTITNSVSMQRLLSCSYISLLCCLMSIFPWWNCVTSWVLDTITLKMSSCNCLQWNSVMIKRIMFFSVFSMSWGVSLWQNWKTNEIGKGCVQCMIW